MINFNLVGLVFGLLVTGSYYIYSLIILLFPKLRPGYYSYRLNEEEMDSKGECSLIKTPYLFDDRVQHVHDFEQARSWEV